MKTRINQPDPGNRPIPPISTTSARRVTTLKLRDLNQRYARPAHRSETPRWTDRHSTDTFDSSATALFKPGRYRKCWQLGDGSFRGFISPILRKQLALNGKGEN